MDNNTIEYYDAHAEEFCAGTIDADMSECLERFLGYLLPGQKILDAGCGSGRDILAFQEAGYDVDAFDASAELCRIASQRTGIAVRQQRFEELTGQELYDGIWACASLLHVSRDELPDVLQRLYRLLKPCGVIYASFKYGDEERFRGERYFCDLTEEVAEELFYRAGFTVIDVFVTRDVREGREDEKWVNVIAKKYKGV